MLDKSLIYKDIVMCLPFEDLEDLKVPVLPDGYSYKMFESGDEIAWAKLEVRSEERRVGKECRL